MIDAKQFIKDLLGVIVNPNLPELRNEQAEAEFAAWETRHSSGHEGWRAGRNEVCLDGYYTSEALRELADLMDKYPPEDNPCTT